VDANERGALLRDARSHRANHTGCLSCVDGIERLAAELAATEERLAGVEALIERWDALSKGESGTTKAIRAALGNPAAPLASLRAEALRGAATAIERRRCARRRRWLRRRRWSAEQESYWSIGMWDAGKVVRALIREIEGADGV
jgi:hypothetical protein